MILKALERARGPSGQEPFFPTDSTIFPPPPTLVFGRKPVSPYTAAVGPPDAVQQFRADEPRGAQDPAASHKTPLQPPAAGGSAGRYAASRPASIFATNRPSEGASIFGEDLISEKSLDEVILSYLAEDLEIPSGSGEKK